MEPTQEVTPIGWHIPLLVPSRNAEWYAVRGYEPLSAGIFRSSAIGSDLVVDIGAHVGFYSLLAAEANPAIPIIAIEASSENVEVCLQNAGKISRNNLEVCHGIFGKTKKFRRFEVTEASDNGGLSGHVNSPTIKIEKVRGITGDELGVPDGKRVLMKIDVEGHELEALRSLEKVVRASSSPRILLKLNPKMLRRARTKTSKVIKLLFSWGLRLFLIDDERATWREIFSDETGLEEEIGQGYRNLYCVRKTEAVSVVAFLHSGQLGGAEISHSEFVVDHVANGGMVATYIPAGQTVISPKLTWAGSSLHGYESSLGWWAVPESDRKLTTPIEDHLTDHKVEDTARSLANWGHDLVLTQTSVFAAGAQVAHALRLPHVWWLREFGDLDHQFVYPLPIKEMGEIFLNHSDLVLANSEAVLRHFFPLGHPRVAVSRPSPKMTPSSRGSHRSDDFTVGVIGNLNPNKGHDVALRAVAACHEKGLPVRLRLIGASSPENLARVAKLVATLEIQSIVELPGGLTRPEEIYRRLDAVIVPSLSEAFGRVPFEATAFGLPVIYSKAGGMLEYMEDCVTGLGFDPGDSQSLGEKIESLVKNQSLVERLVSQAQSSLFNNDAAKQSSEALYTKLRELRRT